MKHAITFAGRPRKTPDKTVRLAGEPGPSLIRLDRERASSRAPGIVGALMRQCAVIAQMMKPVQRSKKFAGTRLLFVSSIAR
jgi:hypothetical protein